MYHPHSSFSQPNMLSPSFTHPSTPITPISIITHILDQAVQLVWDCTFINVQREVTPRSLTIKYALYNRHGLLLVQGDCGGKLLITHTVGCIICGVTLIIAEALDLAANQQSNIYSANGIYG